MSKCYKIDPTRKQTVQKIQFQFDKKIKKNFYTTDYFLKTQALLKSQKINVNKTTTMQFISFNKDNILLCGVNEVVQLLKFALSKKQLKRTIVYAHEDGTIINPKNTPLLVIEGKYTDFAHLENIIDGILSRRCSVATNVMKAQQKLLPHQKIIFMCDRNYDYITQAYDAYPAFLAGIDLFVTKAHASLIKDPRVKIVGTMPHALIQQYQNNLPLLLNHYANYFSTNQVYCLLDYENFAIKTLNDIKNQMHYVVGVRLDTSKNMVDKSIKNTKHTGVNVYLINAVKNWLLTNGFKEKQIVVTSQINDQVIDNINSITPNVDIYGIGSYFLSLSVHVSCDLVAINHRHEAKQGRKLLPNFSKLPKITL